jgi:hypothetical protein
MFTRYKLTDRRRLGGRYKFRGETRYNIHIVQSEKARARVKSRYRRYGVYKRYALRGVFPCGV